MTTILSDCKHKESIIIILVDHFSGYYSVFGKNADFVRSVALPVHTIAGVWTEEVVQTLQKMENAE